MILSKWNCKKHKYEPYEVPDEWDVKLYSDNMEEIVNCSQCGTELKYGATFTSKEIHNYVGLGFAVCYNCYQEEWKRKEESEENE